MIEPIFDAPYERRPKERYLQFGALFEPYPEKFMNENIHNICQRDQGTRGTCVGQSSAYAMDLNYIRITGEVGSLECKRAPAFDELGENAFSADCIYTWSREEAKISFPSGSFIWAAMQALKNRGACLDENWRCAKNENGSVTYITDEVKRVAEDHKIDGYVALNGPEEVKAAIAKYGFCVGGIDVWSNWKEGMKETGAFPEPKGSVIGGHALVWVGYDTEKLYCLHSWAGVPFVGSISWRYFGLCASEFFAIIDENEVRIVKKKYSRVEFRADVPAELSINGTNHGPMPVVLQLENYKILNVVANTGKTIRQVTVVPDGDRTVQFTFLSALRPFDTVNDIRVGFGHKISYSNISRLVALRGVTEDISSLINEFCNDPDEWHAVAFGWMSAGMPGAVKFTLDMIPEYFPEEVKAAIRKEYHYYTFGWYLNKLFTTRIGQAGMGTVGLAGVLKLLGFW